MNLIVFGYSAVGERMGSAGRPTDYLQRLKRMREKLGYRWGKPTVTLKVPG